MRKAALAILALSVASLFSLGVSRAYAQQQVAPDFSFDNFTGTYYLDKDNSGVAILTVQEDLLVEFPAVGSYHGINRAIPKSYQGHDLGLKVISVTDAVGNPQKYTTIDDGKGNLDVNIGDPSIIITGPQSYRLKYQTKGVAAFYNDYDEFLVDVNGRGWQESFGEVQGLVHISDKFVSQLSSKPSCYIGYQNKNYNSCTLTTKNEVGGELITAKSQGSLGPHQAIVMKLDFKKGTFNQKKSPNRTIWMIIAPLLIIAGVGIWSNRKREA